MALKEPDTETAISDFFRDATGTHEDALEQLKRTNAPPRPQSPKRKPTKSATGPEHPDLFPTAHEQRSAQRYIERRRRPDAKPQISFKGAENGALAAVSANHENDSAAAALAMMDTFATGYNNFSNAMALHLQKIVRSENGQVDGQRLAEAVAMIQGMAPKTELETMLAVQMTAIHLGAVESAHLYARAPKHLKAEPALLMSRLSRTFAAQAETFEGIRRGGRQEIHVYHHRDQQPRPPREAADISDGELQRIATGRTSRGDVSQLGQSHEPESLDRPLDIGPQVPREIKEIAAGLPRPRNARS